MASRDTSNQAEPGASRFVWGGFFLLGLLGAFFAPARWEAQTAVLLGVAGLLMILFPPQVRLPRYWWLLGLIFIAAGCLVFLPASFAGGFPAWRAHLEDLGVHTGSKIVVQAPQAAEMLAVFASTLVVGMWLAGHRASPGQLRFWTLAFAVGVAIYSVLSQFTREMEFVHRTDGHFGFFPNRNHTGTYLAMGIVVGLGSFLQAIRDKRPWASALAGLSVAINLLAVVGWSISRGGVLLTGIGGLLWLVAMGPQYLGRHGRRVVALLLLVTVGGYLLADTRVKRRLEKTTEVAASVVSADADATEEVKGEHLEALDFRVPIALDTLSLIRDHLFTGIGAGQFSFVIPQYRERTIGVNNHKILHPESDWLWLASETGVLATGALLVLVAMALFRSFREARTGRDRALRMACLIAAALVAIHGLFDVPGHRIALAWSAALLFALSFRTSRDWKRPAPGVWPARFAGILVLALGGWFSAGVWLGGPPSATGLADVSYDRAVAMYREAVPEGGDLLITKVPRLTQAIELAEKTARLAPLDYRPYGLVGRGDLFFDARHEEAVKAFAVESALNPHWAKIPYLQGLEWAAIDPALSVDSWREALRRADASDRVDARYHEKRGLVRELNKLAKGRPAFQRALSEASKD